MKLGTRVFLILVLIAVGALLLTTGVAYWLASIDATGNLAWFQSGYEWGDAWVTHLQDNALVYIFLTVLVSLFVGLIVYLVFRSKRRRPAARKK